MPTEATVAVPAVTEVATPATPAPVVVPAQKLSPVDRAVAAFDQVVEDAKRRAAAEPAKAKEVVATPTTPEATVSADKVVEPLSSKFAQVAKIERQARETLKAAKAEREAIAKERSEWKARLDAADVAKANAKLDVAGYLAQAGLSYEDVVNYQLNGSRPTPELQVAQLRDEFAQGQKQREEQARREQEQLRAQQTQQLEAWRSGVVDFVRANAAKYELIHQQGAHQLVPTVMQQAFEKSQKVLSEAEAADLVEKHLEQQVEALLKTTKFQARLKPATSEVQPAVTAAQPRTPLTNGLTASSTAVNGQRPGKRSDQARINAALLAMNAGK